QLIQGDFFPEDGQVIDGAHTGLLVVLLPNHQRSNSTTHQFAGSSIHIGCRHRTLLNNAPVVFTPIAELHQSSTPIGLSPARSSSSSDIPPSEVAATRATSCSEVMPCNA